MLPWARSDEMPAIESPWRRRAIPLCVLGLVVIASNCRKKPPRQVDSTAAIGPRLRSAPLQGDTTSTGASNSWRETAPLPAARAYLAVVQSAGHVFAQIGSA